MQILEGVKVLDISCVIAAPSAAALLGDFGADVIRVEAPDQEEEGNYNKILNRNKKRITLDFHKENALAYFYKLAEWADVIIANFRPETMRRFKIDYEDVIKYNPDVIFMHFTAFGRTGPYHDRPGYARSAESFAGLTYLNGEEGGDPLFSGTWVGDSMGGMYAAYMVVLALFHRERTGEGQLLDLGLYEPVFRMLDDVPQRYSTTGQIRSRHGNKHISSAPNNMYDTLDHIKVAMPVNSQNMFARLCHAMERDDLLKAEAFRNPTERFQHRDELDLVVKEWVSSMEYCELEQLLTLHKVAFSRVNSIKEVFEDPHIWERGSLVKVYDEDLKEEIAVNGVCGKFSKTPGLLRFQGRKRDADNAIIYREIVGLTDEEYEKAKTEGIF